MHVPALHLGALARGKTNRQLPLITEGQGYAAAAHRTTHDDWQIVYRQTLQLSRAIEGEEQLLAASTEGNVMEDPTVHRERHVTTRDTTAEQLSLTELVSEISSKAALLVKKEVALARAELREQIASELAVVKALALAAVAGVTTINLLLVAAVFGLLPYAPGWISALGIAGATLLIAAIAAAVGWRKHVQRALPETRRTLKEDVQWAKEQPA